MPISQKEVELAFREGRRGVIGDDQFGKSCFDRWGYAPKLAARYPQEGVLCIDSALMAKEEKRLYKWLDLKSNRFLVILVEGEGGLPIHDKIRCCHVEDEKQMGHIAWEFLFLPFNYRSTDGEMKSSFIKMHEMQQGVFLIGSDYQDLGIQQVRNRSQLAPFLEKAKAAKSLFGSFSQVPAIICGAGISLEGESLHLQRLADKALIFAGGTALSYLSRLGITPHFGGVIDPHPPSLRHFEHRLKEVPLFFQGRAHPALIESHKGPLLWVPGSGNDLFETEVFDGGWNVSTFLVALAYHFGCSPIILVGVDLAQRTTQVYAGGFDRPEGGELIVLPSGLKTRSDWLQAAQWLETFVRDHPDVEWLNASDGLALEGFDPISLSQVLLKESRDLKSWVGQEINSIREGASVTLSVSALNSSLQRVSDLCVALLDELQRLFPGLPKEGGEYLRLALEIEKEMAYKEYLRPVWEIWKHVVAREVAKGTPPVYGIELNKWLFMKGICNDTAV